MFERDFKECFGIGLRFINPFTGEIICYLENDYHIKRFTIISNNVCFVFFSNLVVKIRKWFLNVISNTSLV